MAENTVNTQQPLPTSTIKKSLGLKSILVFIFIGLVLGVGGASLYFFNTRNRLPPIELPNPSLLSPIPTPMIESFFNFRIPPPIDQTTIYDLPNTAHPNNIIRYKNHLWFTSDGSLIEYDPKTQKMVAYSNAKKYNCGRDIVLIHDYIYAPCNIDNIDDAFGTTNILHTTYFTGHSGILRIDPNTHNITKVFSKQDGLVNQYNLQLYTDNEDIWVGTFDGVARINTTNDKVAFFKQQLGFPDVNKSYSINHLIIDKDYVWVFFGSHVESQGGVALYNKKTDTWTAFGPSELKESPERFDLDFGSNSYHAKLIPNGIQIAFRDGKVGNEDKLVEKQYNYDTKVWRKVTEYVATGADYDKTYKLLESTYPTTHQKYSFVDSSGLVQLKIPGENKTYQLDGRTNYILSQLVNGKRYILTSGTVDVIDDSQPFRQIVVKLEKQLLGSIGFAEEINYQQLIHFFVDPQTMLALVIHPSCEGMGCDGHQSAWLVDLNNKEIKKIYTVEDKLPAGDKLSQKLKFSTTGDSFVITNEKNEEVFRINTTNFDLLVPSN